MNSVAKVLDPAVAKLATRAPLDDSDKAALLQLPFRLRTCEAGLYLVREGSPTTECILILEGFAFRHKLTMEGERQIVSIHMNGDFVDLQGALLRVADHNVQALTRCQVATFPAKEIVSLIERHPKAGRALWIDTLIDGSIFREWVMNVGRRPAKERIGHLICEIGRRMEAVGILTDKGFALPMTQEQLADATGLTSVHVNRTLKALEAEGLIKRERRYLEVPDWAALRSMSGFNELYLHLDQMNS